MDKSKIKDYLIYAVLLAALVSIPFLSQTVPISGS
jgi:hypothetical protein